MLDIESYVKCESFAMRPIELGAFENRGIIVAIVVYQLHECPVPLARAERHYSLYPSVLRKRLPRKVIRRIRYGASDTATARRMRPVAKSWANGGAATALRPERNMVNVKAPA